MSRDVRPKWSDEQARLAEERRIERRKQTIEFFDLQEIGSSRDVTGAAMGPRRRVSTQSRSTQSLVQQTQDESMSRRLAELERRIAAMEIPGDFNGTVTGKWEGIGDQGEGLVSYKGKTYKTKRMGFASIPLGAPVELVYANGVYYSNY